jgi:hypothetical protein
MLRIALLFAALVGLDVDETGDVLKVWRRTVMRDWTLARTWLFRELRKSPSVLKRD